jgi:hypothetical protein
MSLPCEENHKVLVLLLFLSTYQDKMLVNLSYMAIKVLQAMKKFHKKSTFICQPMSYDGRLYR